MFKKLFFCFFLVNAGLFLFGQVGDRHYEPQSNYSICPPRSWMILPYPGQPLKTFVEDAADGYPGIMTFVSSLQPGSTVEKKWQVGQQNLARAIPNYKAISTSEFVTNKGLKGIRHIYTQKAGVYDQRVVLYTFVNSNGRSVTINCGVLLKHGSKYDKVFDESVATLEIAN